MCDHKHTKTLVKGEYESSSSSGYMISPALYWCSNCGAYAWEEPSSNNLKWKTPFIAQVVKEKKNKGGF